MIQMNAPCQANPRAAQIERRRSRGLSRHPQDVHPGRRGSLLPGIPHLPAESRPAGTGKYGTRDRVREDPDPGEEDTESVIKMNDRHFTEPVDEISGTVDEVSAGGITLNEYPGRRFQFSSV